MNASSATAGAARGAATRESLLNAAIDVFGRDGFSAASTRAISRAAGVNQALIGYHFGGKPGLYLAALRYIVDGLKARMEPLLEAIEAQLPDAGKAVNPAPDTGQALALLHRLTDAFVQVLTSDESSSWARLILREQQDPSEGFDVLYSGIMHRMLGITTRLVCLARRSGTAGQNEKLMAVTILGQALVFRAARTAVLREMGWGEMTAVEVDAIKATLRRNVAAMLEPEERT
jgi:TetR/AcrR family transcriptional regulator, regulator of cefoperazone and chloramphenicol sensitivity